METTSIDLQLSSYDFDVPKELIAQQPLKQRDAARLMVLERSSGSVTHARFSDIADYLKPGDCLVVNKTRVIPARVYGKRETGGKVEVLFLRQEPDGDMVTALVRPFLPAGARLALPGGLSAVIEGTTPDGEMRLRLSGAVLKGVLETYGEMPVPPYIKRSGEAGGALKNDDRRAYQTVFSQVDGSIAAPTAGLHFTPELLDRVRAAGIAVVEVMLHVGWGTFRPVRVGAVNGHRMLPEYYEITRESAAEIERCRRADGRVVAVGTTAVRALESAFSMERDFPVSGATELFIYPGYQFKIVQAMVTNFHVPRSTPLLMASAFAGRRNLLTAYAEAIRETYRFFSYGDAMLIL